MPILNDVKEQRNTQNEEILTVNEAAEYLKVAKPTLYRYIQNNQIPYFKIGTTFRFDKNYLRKWIVEQLNRVSI